MYYHVDYRRYKAVLKRLLSILLIFTLYFNSFSVAHAAGQKSPAGWSKTIELVPLDDVIEATARKQAIRNGSSVTLEAVVRETVNRQAAGKVLLSRILGGGLAIGGMAALISAVGWVMEDGAYVKYKQSVSEPTVKPLTKFYYRYDATNSEDFGKFKSCKGIYSTLQKLQSCLSSVSYSGYSIIKNNYFDSRVNDAKNELLNSTQSRSIVIASELYFVSRDSVLRDGFAVFMGVDVSIPPNQENKPQRIVLTSDLVGDLAVGDYTDPVDSKYDKKDKKWTGVGEAYDYDSTGIGNDLSDSLDSKFDSAPELVSRPDGKPQTDAPPWKYPVEKGTEGTTDQEKDADGNPTGKGSFELPAFCTWAATMCAWYSDWKQSDARDAQFQDTVKKHYEDEKTFWDKVKEWFDWTKADSKLPDQDNEPPEIKEIEPPRLNTSTFRGTPGCPAPIQVNVTIGSKGTTEISYEPICQFAEKWSFVSPLIGFLSGAMILIGVGRKGEDSEI